MILATDLDRTLIPNGPEAYDGTLPELFSLLTKHRIKIIYVTGRNLELTLEASAHYGIPLPDYLIAEVGTVVYKKENIELKLLTAWRERILQKTPGWNRSKIEKEVEDELLTLQEGWKQNEFKVSYYLRDHAAKDRVFEKIQSAITHLRINAEVIWSFDPLQNNVGLIDILPKEATKISALEFVRNLAGASKEDVIYCGDSGNDLFPLTFGYRSILVRNAPEEVKDEVLKIAKEKNVPPPYIASGKDGLNGNYSSGIIEGLKHFKIALN